MKTYDEKMDILELVCDAIISLDQDQLFELAKKLDVLDELLEAVHERICYLVDEGEFDSVTDDDSAVSAVQSFITQD